MCEQAENLCAGHYLVRSAELLANDAGFGVPVRDFFLSSRIALITRFKVPTSVEVLTEADLTVRDRVLIELCLCDPFEFRLKDAVPKSRKYQWLAPGQQITLLRYGDFQRGRPEYRIQ